MASPARLYTHGVSGNARADFAADVRAGLTTHPQKELPSKYLYDEIGSALFEVITLLPEYGLSRAGARLLKRHSEEIIDRLPSPVAVAELGSGSGAKTRWILEALSRRQPVTYYPIDISRTALSRCWQELGRIDSVSIVGFERAYLDGLLDVASRRKPGECLLVLFLGSTIGNFDRPAAAKFLREVRHILHRGDALLLATDLEKSVSELLLAYDDPAGVTAAFNLNLLARINRELDGSFDLSSFRHEARYNREHRRIEMHLRSARKQTACVSGASLDVTLEEGETIWTESSHKYRCDEAAALGSAAGFSCEAQWVDPEWPYAQSLFLAE
ncbi:MAG TPA: L-histidine N(alpha)-methyltransferase [Candidatus Acidoferrales bacterium]|nr:L-histidine N(alpha)-methyltransferase [Candidatus Acidoferrales bacterium]